MTSSVCEVCGKVVERVVKATVDDAELSLCPLCLSKLGKRAKVIEEETRRTLAQKKSQQSQTKRQTSVRTSQSIEILDLVEGYGDVIRKGREKKGWTQEVLAQKLRVSVDVVRKIESEKYKPPIDLAKRIEKLLGVRLLTSTEEEPLGEVPNLRGTTLGEVVVVRREEKQNS
ncbi:MAG: multiprotein bridging factor aMBF1 [Acidilobaceae archaeon]